jgi:flagellar motor protein MotB
MADRGSNARPSCFAVAWSIGMLTGVGLLMLEAPEAAAFTMTGPVEVGDDRILPIQESAQPDQPFLKFNEELAAARSKLEQLAGLADAIGSLRKQLDASLEVNQRLSAELAEVKSEREARQRAALEAEGRIAELSAAAEEATAQITRSRRQLEESQQKLVIAQTSRQEAEARIAELQTTVDDLQDQRSRFGSELEARQGQLDQSEAAQAGAEQERDALAAKLDLVEGEAADLRAQLTGSENELERVRAAYAELESRSGEFAVAARAMLGAIDARVEEFDAVLTKANLGRPAAGGARAASAEPASAGLTSAGNGASTPPADEVVEVAISDVDAALDLAVAAPPTDGLGPDRAAGDGGDSRNLMAALGAEETDLGLLIVLPGGLLFTTNSAAVQESGLGLMADATALINAHGNPNVLILGHTDDIGEADYNLALSQRRAGSVKRAFVDHFGLDPDRLEAHGLGEARPIASNRTREGREVNRRIEVLIVNDDVTVSPETLATQ